MSRTKHHRFQKHRHGGHDLWSRRGWKYHYCTVGKRLSLMAEKAREKEQLIKEIKESLDA